MSKIQDKENENIRASEASAAQEEAPEEREVEGQRDKEELHKRTKKELLDRLLSTEKEKEQMVLEMETLLKKNEEIQESLARLRADHYNYRQRVERDRQKERENAAEKAVLQFLPLLDNLERALGTAQGEENNGTLEGVRMVYKQFLKILDEMGVKQIPTVGNPFSPQLHEGVMLQDVDQPEEDGMVICELEKGYTMGDRVIRPAKVQVGKYSG